MVSIKPVDCPFVRISFGFMNLGCIIAYTWWLYPINAQIYNFIALTGNIMGIGQSANSTQTLCTSHPHEWSMAYLLKVLQEIRPWDIKNALYPVVSRHRVLSVVPWTYPLHDLKPCLALLRVSRHDLCQRHADPYTHSLAQKHSAQEGKTIVSCLCSFSTFITCYFKYHFFFEQMSTRKTRDEKIWYQRVWNKIRQPYFQCYWNWN